MTRDEMVEIVKRSMALQDVGEVDGQIALFAEDCTFRMPVRPAPLVGREALRQSVAAWPKATTEQEWFAVDGDRIVAAWSWRGEGWPDDAPLLRGVSSFVFNADGLIQEYEDWFDPGWLTRHDAAPEAAGS